jgi:hypothetical protein
MKTRIIKSKNEKPKEEKVAEEPNSIGVADLPLEIPQPKKIKVDYSNVHFRGVFATEDIESGELIERCPMVPLEHRMRYHNDPQLYNYLYSHKCDCEDCKKHGGTFLMVLGYGMIYNHQDTPNTTWVFNHEKKVADVVATMPIKKGKEIFVSYGSDYFKYRKKVVLDEFKGAEVNDSEEIPKEWMSWIKENIGRGVNKAEIKKILLSNNFEEKIINKVLGD